MVFTKKIKSQTKITLSVYLQRPQMLNPASADPPSDREKKPEAPLGGAIYTCLKEENI